MASMDNRDVVLDQYANAQNLATRKRLHDLYSVNPMGWMPWLFSQYRFSPGCKILELGSGTGALWENRLDDLPIDSTLVLSDFSPGMVGTLQSLYGGRSRVLSTQVDVQSIPFAEASFDVVIANHMLYHVPDLQAAIDQLYRVLKPGGTLYCSTNGNGGMPQYLNRAFRAIDPALNLFADTAYSFTLQNGEDILRHRFQQVRVLVYEDALHITCTQDLIDWIASTTILSGMPERLLEPLYAYFEAIRVRDGAIHIPKEAGTFIATKEAQ